MLKLVPVSLSLVAASFAMAGESSAVQAIRRADAAWVRAAATKKVDAWMAFYAPGATVLPPNEPVATTTKAIRASMAAFLSLPNLKITWSPTSIKVARSGDMGYSFGRYKVSFRGPDGVTVNDTGKNVEIWQRQPNGAWKCIVDTWNSDLPADPQMAEWSARYEEYCRPIRTVDFLAWKKYVAKECTWVKADGKVLDYDAMMREVSGLFEAKSIAGGETVLGVTKKGNAYEIAYSEDWHLTFANGHKERIKAGGTDVWQRINGKWKIVKTIDTPTVR